MRGGPSREGVRWVYIDERKRVILGRDKGNLEHEAWCHGLICVLSQLSEKAEAEKKLQEILGSVERESAALAQINREVELIYNI